MKRLIIFISLLSTLSLAMAFNHPGLLHSKESIQRMRSLRAEENAVAMGSYQKLVADAKASADYQMRGPFDIIARDGQHAKTKGPCENDFLAAYYNALLYVIDGDKAHAQKAMEIIRAYGKTLVRIDGHDAPLCAALQGFVFINACELMRYAKGSGWTKEDTKLTERMFREAFLPVLNEFDRKSPYANGNWGAAACKLRIAIGVYCNDKAQYQRATNYFLHGNDDGALPHYVAESGQCQESGRDQAHVMLGLGQLAEICEVAWSQGDDLYGALDNRMMAGYEYTSKANLGFQVPFFTWKDLTGKYCNWTCLSDGALGQWRAVFEIAYNHYVGRKHLAMPYTAKVLGHYVRPEGAGFTCDNPGFGTLLFYEGTEVDTTSPVPATKQFIMNEKRDYDVTEEPVIKLKGISHLSLVRTVDCWPEYWDLKPVRKVGDVNATNGIIYEYEPKGAISRNGYRIEEGKVKTTFVAEKLNADAQIEYCIIQARRSMEELSPVDYTHSPRNIGAGECHWNLRNAKTAEEWCSGFWPGIMWMVDDTLHAKRYTNELEFLAYQKAYDHDLGFQMIGSFLKGYEWLNDNVDKNDDNNEDRALKEHYRKVLLAAADTLATLFNPRVGTLLSWPRNVGMFGGHNTIIDNMINLELLFFSGKKENIDIAVSHADTTMRYHFRPDGTINHVAVYDPVSGKHLYNCTHQGFGDNTLWSRGQAWAIYGYTMVYRYTHEKRFLDFVQKVTDVMLRQLPADGIPLWDMGDPMAPHTFRDASAAAIIASGLIELSGHVGGEKGKAYLAQAEAILTTLSSAEYQCREKKPAFLLHSVGNMPAGSEVDASINYADYYYIEALKRLKAHNL